mmetsp:Transcript_96371/g.173884  ORF Transcript_96371/g.173884 Transcript_96371/m.173884 type:complete len:280 (+) Transcript_96371:55-894(+)
MSELKQLGASKRPCANLNFWLIGPPGPKSCSFTRIWLVGDRGLRAGLPRRLPPPSCPVPSSCGALKESPCLTSLEATVGSSSICTGGEITLPAGFGACTFRMHSSSPSGPPGPSAGAGSLCRGLRGGLPSSGTLNKARTSMGQKGPRMMNSRSAVHSPAIAASARQPVALCAKAAGAQVESRSGTVVETSAPAAAALRTRSAWAQISPTWVWDPQTSASSCTRAWRATASRSPKRLPVSGKAAATAVSLPCFEPMLFSQKPSSCWKQLMTFKAAGCSSF